ncbi:hypothetical protein ONZ45_g14865 [Pleurotus djamor]|nr:hypothetical protein ONZ45_g14865 [Pleurotus djamor]
MPVITSRTISWDEFINKDAGIFIIGLAVVLVGILCGSIVFWWGSGSRGRSLQDIRSRTRPPQRPRRPQRSSLSFILDAFPNISSPPRAVSAFSQDSEVQVTHLVAASNLASEESPVRGSMGKYNLEAI